MPEQPVCLNVYRGIDFDASLQADVDDAPSSVQPPRAAKLRRVAVVEASDSG